MWVLWVILGLVLLGFEVHTQQFYAMFLALGAFAAAVGSAAGVAMPIDGVLFAGVAIAGSLLVRPALMHWVDTHSSNLAVVGTSSGLVGQQAITADSVGDIHHPGHAVPAGARWLAVTPPRIGSWEPATLSWRTGPSALIQRWACSCPATSWCATPKTGRWWKSPIRQGC